MIGKAIAVTILMALLLVACARPGGTTPPTATMPATSAATAAATTAPVTTPAPEKPQYGGTLNLVMIADISSWDQGLTFC